MDDDAKALALALVRGHVMDDAVYLTWIPAHTSIRTRARHFHHPPHRRFITTTVGGHWRRQPHITSLIRALPVTCKLPPTHGRDALADYRQYRRESVIS